VRITARSLFWARIILIWLALVSATVLPWELGQGAGFANIRRAGTAIIVVASVNVRLVILDLHAIGRRGLSCRSVRGADRVVPSLRSGRRLKLRLDQSVTNCD
jgi:hypothetical protein